METIFAAEAAPGRAASALAAIADLTTYRHPRCLDPEVAGVARFRPPCPPRPSHHPKPWQLFAKGRRNLLSVWPDFTYASGSFSCNVLGRRIHVVSTPDVVREVFVDKADDVAEKTWQQRHILKPLAGNGLIVSGGEVWRDRRQKIAPITHISQLQFLSRNMTAGAARLRRGWIERGNDFEVDVLREMACLTAGIVMSAIFEREADPAIVARIVDAFDIYQSRVRQVDAFALFSSFDRLPRLIGWRTQHAARAIRRDLHALIAAAERAGGHRAAFLKHFYASRPGRTPRLDREACCDEAAVMLLAGHETTANTLAWAFFLLSQDPESESRLHAEVDRALGQRCADFDDLAALPFTRAIIQETLRLYPPVPIQARRATRAFRIGQKQVAAGDTIILNAWILHRHRRIWDEPDSFVPERFMPGGAGPPSRYAYVPFGIGPRVCTGAAFGQTEAIICLATLAQRFQLRLRPGTVVEPICRLSLRPGPALPMLVRQRI